MKPLEVKSVMTGRVEDAVNRLGSVFCILVRKSLFQFDFSDQPRGIVGHDEGGQTPVLNN